MSDQEIIEAIAAALAIEHGGVAPPNPLIEISLRSSFARTELV